MQSRILSLLVLAAVLFLSRGDGVGILGILSDGFSMAGLFSLCVGILAYVSQKGGFNMLGYGVSRLYRGLKGEKSGESYFSYVSRKTDSKNWLSPVRDGGIMVGIGLAFLLLWQIFEA